MRRRATRRPGTAVGNEPPADGGLVWSYAADVKTFFASPAVVGNRVYVSSADKGPLRDRGAIYCLDADSGGLVWKAAPSGYVATFSSPVVAGKFLVCGEGLHYTLNAAGVLHGPARGRRFSGPTRPTATSSPRRASTTAGSTSAPATTATTVSVWSPTPRAGRWCSGMPRPSATPMPTPRRWCMTGGWSSAAACDGNAICCLDAETGAELWRVAHPVSGVRLRPRCSAGGS